MSFVGSGTTGTEAAQKFLESLQNDFRNLSAETKKKNPQIKEVSKSPDFSQPSIAIVIKFIRALSSE